MSGPLALPSGRNPFWAERLSPEIDQDNQDSEYTDLHTMALETQAFRSPPTVPFLTVGNPIWGRQFPITSDYRPIMASSDQTIVTLKQDTGPVSPSTQEETTSSASEPTSNSSSGPSFLSLPYELRLEIYNHLLLLPPTPPQTLHPQILRACRQIHAEALPLLYGRNTFEAHASLLVSFPRLRPWYSPVASASAAALITRVRVRVRLDAGAGFGQMRATRELSGRDEVVIDCWQAAYRSAGWQVLRLFEGVRGVRRARVTGSIGGFEEYARWLERSMMSDEGAEVAAYWGEEDELTGRFGKRELCWDGMEFVLR